MAAWFRTWTYCALLLCCANLTLFVSPVKTQSTAKGVVDADGHEFDPFHRNSGKVIVFLFIRTDCPISNRYAPTIQEISAHYANRVEMYLVYPVKAETSQQIHKHLKEYGYRLPAVRDPEYSLVKSGEVRVTPEAAVFSANGRLLYHGRIDDQYVDIARPRRTATTHELSVAIEAAIGGKAPAHASSPAVGCFLPDRP